MLLVARPRSPRGSLPVGPLGLWVLVFLGLSGPPSFWVFAFYRSGCRGALGHRKVGITESTESAESTESTESTECPERPESPESIESFESTERTESTRSVKSAESAESAEAASDHGMHRLRTPAAEAWEGAVTECVEKCRRCFQCRSISVSVHWRMCWTFRHCPQIGTYVGGFVSGQVRQ